MREVGASAGSAGDGGGATVFIVDDERDIRRSVARLVRAAGYTAKTFSSPAEFLRCELPDGPACVLLDMCMGEMTGLDVQDALRGQDSLRQNARQIPIVFLSGQGTISSATAGIKHGADDFLEKPVRPKLLMEAIRRAIERDKSLSVQRRELAELKRRHDTLTPREREVMGFVVSGLLNKQAAADLACSEKTIKVHRARVMQKMGVISLAALVQRAGRLGPIVVMPPAARGARAIPEFSSEMPSAPAH